MTTYLGLARALIAVTLIIAFSAVIGPANALDITRYASPTGSGTSCTQAHPCGIVEAINNAPSGATVNLESGAYGSPRSPLTTTLSDVSTDNLRITGQTGRPNPLIYSAAHSTAILLVDGSSLSHVDLVSTKAGGALLVDGSDVDHVGVLATRKSSFACAVAGDLSDSLCVDTGVGGAAAAYEEGGGSITVSLDNDTAIATRGTGVFAAATSSADVTVAPTDTIVRGTLDDVSAATDGTSTVEVDLDHSAYRPGHVSISGSGTASVVNKGGNTRAAPKFVAPASGDYAEAAGSPTIDAGLERIGPDTDLAGNPRTVGKTTDIGAYEFLPKPRVGKIHVNHIGAHTLAATVPVNPHGFATSVRLIARHGHGHKTSHQVRAGGGHKTIAVHLKLRGLAAGTKYHLVATATNGGGTTTSPGKDAKTKGTKPRQHHSRAWR